MDFKGAVAVVTGASSGIGARIALDFAQKGARMVLLARNRERLDGVAACAEKLGAETLVLACDVGDISQVQEASAAIRKRFGRVDVLVNGAGVGYYRPFREQALGELHEMVSTNFMGVLYVTRELLPLMARGAHIVNISSVAGRLGTPNFGVYAATKFALNGFSEALYHELSADGIDVHVIMPDVTRTRFFANDSFAGASPPKNSMMDPSVVSRAVLRAVEGNRFETMVSNNRAMGVALLFKSVSPNAFSRMAGRKFAKKRGLRR